MDKRLALMCGIDIPVPECEMVVHQPRIKEIAYIGENDFFVGAQSFCINKYMLQQGKSPLENMTNFQVFMTIMKEKETLDKKIAVQQIFPLFFPEYTVNILPRSLAFRGKSGIITVDDKNFDALQETISDICCFKSNLSGDKGFNPSNAKAAEIAKKLMRGRQRVAEQNGENNSSILSQYISSLTIGIPSMSLQDLMDLTLFQLYDLIERYSLFMNWDIDIRSRLAGAKPESKPDNWMKNIH